MKWWIAPAAIWYFALLTLLSSCKVDKQELARQAGLSNLSLASVPDGVHEGAYTLALPPGVMAANKSARVRVTVAGARITGIEVLEPAAMGRAKWIQQLLARVTADQRLAADAITSATVTSMAVLRAVQEALAAAGAQAAP